MEEKRVLASEEVQPVLLFTSSVNPSQAKAAYPAAHPQQFRFSTPDRPVFYRVHGLCFGVVR